MNAVTSEPNTSAFVRKILQNEEEVFNTAFGLDRFGALLAPLGNPERRFPSVLVGGTNGKGSTSALLAAMAGAAGYRVGVVSNADGRVEALFDQVGLTPYVEFVIDSHVVGVAKPDPRIFRMGAERLRLPPEECLYVGDLYAVDVLGARAAGLRPLLLDPFERHADWDDVQRIRSVVELPGWLETHR